MHSVDDAQSKQPVKFVQGMHVIPSVKYPLWQDRHVVKERQYWQPGINFKQD